MTTERNAHHVQRTAAIGVAVPLGAAFYYAADGLYTSHLTGGLDHTLSIASRFLENTQLLNFTDALNLASTYPNEMSAVISFGIAAVCGMAALGSLMGYAYYEANHE